MSLAGKTARTNRHGVTTIRAPRARLAVSVSARGYAPVRTRVDFRGSRWQTLDVYQPDLQWPLYGATEARTQAPTQIRLRPPFRLVWSRGLGRLIEFPAVVVDGMAYIGNAAATVHAISMRSGNFAWVHHTPGAPRMASSPAVYGNEIVYHTMSGRVYVLDRSDGRLLWSWNAGAAIEPSPIIIDGIDYFGDAGGEMYALDLHTHQLKWRRYLGAKITSSAAIESGRLFVGDYAGRLWALSPATGSTRWVKTVNGKIYGTPAVADGRVFVPSSTGNSLTAFTTSGRYLWRSTAGYYVYSSPAVADGVVCWGSYSGWFYGSSAATGAHSLADPDGRPDLGSGRDRGRRRVRRQLLASHHRREPPHRTPPLDVPPRPVRPRLGERRTAALQRLLAHLRGRAAPLEAAAARALTGPSPVDESALMTVGYRRPS